MNEHTLGPFIARGERIYQKGGSTTSPIATIHPLDGTRDKLDTDAAFFTRAVNSHDALLEALKAHGYNCGCGEWHTLECAPVDSVRRADCTGDHICDEDCAMDRAALKLAKGEN